jgi:uncharacterized protein (TIGR02444 family)
MAGGRLDNPLWRFALAHYRRRGVAVACLALQDGAGIDVNLLMFALWHGASGRGRLGRTALSRLVRAVAAWQSQVVMPLRDLRRRLKPLVDDPTLGLLVRPISGLRSDVKRLELEAERVELAMLFAMARAPIRSALDAQTRNRAARQNVARYLEIAAGTLDRRLAHESKIFIDALASPKRLKRKSDSKSR